MPRTGSSNLLEKLLLIGLIFTLFLSGAALAAGLSHGQLAAIRSVSAAEASPDGRWVAYRLDVPRIPGEDEDGSARRELHLISTEDGSDRTFVGGDVRVGQIAFTADSKQITFVAKRGEDEHDTLWAIPVDGGEARQVLTFENAVKSYAVSPDGKQVAFVAKEPEDESREKAKEKGYKQEVFEEDWSPVRVWLADFPPLEEEVRNPDAEEEEAAEPKPLELSGSAFEVQWSADGDSLLIDIAPRPLIDDKYMLRKVHVLDPATGRSRATLNNPGKLGRFRISPDGKNVAMISAADPNDPKEGRLMVASAQGGDLRDLLPNLEGHVRTFAWKDAATLMFIADEGVETRLGEIAIKGGKVKTHLVSGGKDGQPLLTALSLSGDGKRVVLVGERPTHPAEVFTLDGTNARRLTRHNRWLDDVDLARQESVRFNARDGLELGGILIHPLDGKKPAPLLLMVHGGPESHDRNGWRTNYSRPGQIAAAQGYAVFYPNYRGSTGRGVAFSKTSQGDAAGKEFDDLVDAVKHFAAEGIADKDRVGITGGSYGGYATAWSSTKLSEHFRAGVMFVGISNKISKGMTTEIPVEDKMVHTLFDPWTKWDFSLERSPIYHAENSRTALLIATGTADTRVHPSQSLQLYRALKLIGKTPVRFVRYPGEGHGNRKAAARDDYSRRLMRWMDHFLVDGATELPPWDLGLGVDESDEDEEEVAEK